MTRQLLLALGFVVGMTWAREGRAFRVEPDRALPNGVQIADYTRQNE